MKMKAWIGNLGSIRKKKGLFQYTESLIHFAVCMVMQKQYIAAHVTLVWIYATVDIVQTWNW